MTVGRVGTLHLTKDGVIVDLKIDKGEKIPARTHAQVEELSAVGEQYVDLRPYTDSGPYLKNGSRDLAGQHQRAGRREHRPGRSRTTW